MEEKQIIYQLEIGMRTEKQLGENTPGAYRIVEAGTPSGIMVYGLYGESWKPNPGTRELIAHLLRCIKTRNQIIDGKKKEVIKCRWQCVELAGQRSSF
jgi:hypothetical protein